jgi:putative ABC transport system substrate-binding protein
MLVTRMPVQALLGLACGLLAAPLAADAQQRANMARIGVLGSPTASSYATRIEAFKRGLQELGYVDGQNIAIEYRWAEGRYERLPTLAAELVRLRVDVIVTHGTPATRAAQQATTTIPIVMATSGDAVGTGLVASLPRPGGNTTGSTFLSPEINAKRLELLKEAVPRIRRVAALLNPGTQASDVVFKQMELTARALGIEVRPAWLRREDELDSTFSELLKARSDGIVIEDDPVLASQARRIANLAAKNRLPTATSLDHAQTGSLLSYGASFEDLWRRAAIFVDKILKGAKPADLPVEQPTRFELVINLKTAKALGSTIPRSVMGLADRVIQ